MSSKAELIDLEDTATALPPVICSNPRSKIEPEEVDITDLILLHKGHREKPSAKPPVPDSVSKLLQPCPRYPLSIIWSPNESYFELDKDPIIYKLWLWNACYRTIYLHCCGLWDETARLGASWCCYPRTRFHLAPGLKTTIFIKATPRQFTPVAQAFVGLQIAASHMRDTVVGYFAIPIVVKFCKYKPPCQGEVESKSAMSN